MTSEQHRNIRHRQTELSHEEANVRTELYLMDSLGTLTPEQLTNMKHRQNELLDHLAIIEKERQFMETIN
jgi:hypothetical protein